MLQVKYVPRNMMHMLQFADVPSSAGSPQTIIHDSQH